MKTGGSLRAWRKKMGRSLREIAEIIGVSEVAISDWERGKKRPRETHARLIETLTGGTVSAAAWLSEKERRERATAEGRVSAASEVAT